MHLQRGFGLIEIIIGIALSSFIVLLLTRQYIHIKKNYLSIQSSLEQTIDLMLVIDLLRDSIRRAGFTPCLGIDYLEARDRRSEVNHLSAFEIKGEQSSVLEMNRMSERFDTVKRVIDSTNVTLTNIESIRPKQALLIADCYHAEVQTITQVKHVLAGRMITFAKPLAFTYLPPIYIGQWIEEAYFIHEGHSEDESALHYRLHHSEELTMAIHRLSAELITAQGKRVLRIKLGLGKGKNIEINTRVRIA